MALVAPAVRTRPRAGRDSRGTSRGSNRAASIALAVVVSILAVFSIVAAYATRVQVEEMRHAELLQASYQDVIVALHETDTAVTDYVLDPSSGNRATLGQTHQPLITAVSALDHVGTTPSTQLAQDMRSLLDRYLVVSTELTAATTATNLAELQRIDQDEADPILSSMVDRVTTAANAQELEAERLFNALQNTAQSVLVLSPVIFVIGSALMLMLWRTRERSYRQSEKLSQLRKEFVETISHEFRTPLTGIQGFSELMRDEDLTLAEMREYAADINKDAKRLGQFIIEMVNRDPELSAERRVDPPVDPRATGRRE